VHHRTAAQCIVTVALWVREERQHENCCAYIYIYVNILNQMQLRGVRMSRPVLRVYLLAGFGLAGPCRACAGFLRALSLG
jgi:hypothetical protein